jgi:hypothetical protein
VTARPAPVRITDLANPRFTPQAQAVLDAMAEMGKGIALDAESLLAAACAATGLDDFDETTAWRERLDVYLHALAVEAPLSDRGRLINHTQISQLLTNRLLVTDLLRRHPEIHDVEIVAPIVIVGLPRTGTTHLHNLIAADPALRSLQYWESLEPVAPAGEPEAARVERCEAGLWLLDEAMPYFKRMHEMTARHVHEEIQLLAIDMSTMLFETGAVMPSWRDYYRSHDQTATYRYLRTLLQVCAWQTGTVGRRWVLKSPQHLEQLAPLMQVFPDARVVFTHRDPASVVASFVMMGAYTARLSHRAPIDIEAIGRYWCDRILDLYEASVAGRRHVPASQAIDVPFDRFMADDLAAVEWVYEVAGQSLGDDARAAIGRFMADHPRGLHGTVDYDLAEFGLNAAEIRSRAEAYIDRFDVSLEDRW